MAGFAKAPSGREQLVLFPAKLDEVIPADHRVRLLDELLRRVDWTKWEAQYDLHRGQPPIHPRVMASAILYGVINRILSSRALEEALLVRNDFRWLVEGHTIDHTTFCKFRISHQESLRDVFVQIGLIAREMGHLTLQSLGFDGTRIRANNRRRGSRTPEALRQISDELAAQFKELEDKAAALDAEEDRQYNSESRSRLHKELADVERRQAQIDAALQQLAQSKNQPSQIPIIDPESRVLPNKEGGYAPNYTPCAAVDTDSGLIVSATVIPSANEDKQMLAAVDDVQQAFELEEPPGEMLADGLMATSENLAQCKERGIDLYSPIRIDFTNNPAVREDPRQPVDASVRDQLPKISSKGKDGTILVKLSKDAFVYDKQENCCWCPMGKRLTAKPASKEFRNGQERIRMPYRSEATDCHGCPLAELCRGSKSKTRTIRHELHEVARLEHAEKMQKPESKERYERRLHACERPFAVIKAQYGARQFLTRGLQRVRQEWTWLASAFNINRLMSLIAQGAQPP